MTRDPAKLKAQRQRAYAKNRLKILARKAANRVAINKRAKEYRDQNRAILLLRGKQTRWELKITVLTKYGGLCVCCGEDEPRFLTIDHIDGGGLAEVKKLSGGKRGTVKWYRHLRNVERRTDLQILCWNCNCGRSQNSGVCPHML